MARTKQTAKKTTGAIGQRQDISSSGVRLRNATQASTANSPGNSVFRMLSSNSLGDDNALCNGCSNGGKMIGCNNCSNWTCYSILGEDDGQGCITLSKPGLINDDTRFLCPSCHFLVDRTEKIPSPYIGIFTRVEPVAGSNAAAAGAVVAVEGAIANVDAPGLYFFPRLNAKETLLLFIAVKGAEQMDEPIVFTWQLLHQFFGRGQGNLHFASIIYDLSTTLGVDAYSTQIESAVEFIKQHRCRVVVYFVTHTTPDGDLHFSGPQESTDNRAGWQETHGFSNTPTTILSNIFTSQFLDALQSIKETTLFLLICGGYLGHSETVEWVNSSVARQSFREVVTFTSKKFQPFWAAPFCARFVQRFYLEAAPYPAAMVEVLAGDARLGARTDVVVVRRDENARNPLAVQRLLFFWTQETRAPFGIHLPGLCPTCKCFKTLSATTPSEFQGTKLRISCSHRIEGKRCGYEVFYNINAGRIRGPRHFYGEWFSEVL